MQEHRTSVPVSEISWRNRKEDSIEFQTKQADFDHEPTTSMEWRYDNIINNLFYIYIIKIGLFNDSVSALRHSMCWLLV
jgi:hypothetical protein